MTKAFIAGAAGPSLSPDEAAFLRDERPFGFILFKRNIQEPNQVRDLIGSVRDALGSPLAAVLVDQEGGRVQRLGPPHWPSYPPGAAFGHLYRQDVETGLAAARLGARLIAVDLFALGINVNCLPLADLALPGADPIIGDRAYGSEPSQVGAIARAVGEGLLAGGVLPVLKHLPGHGRASADSHLTLPIVETSRLELEKTDFAAFRAAGPMPLGMTAHVVYAAIDPAQPATCSSVMINDVIRGAIGFDGLLMSDDVSMGALVGTIAERSRSALSAGCDIVLHCNGRFEEMRAVAAATPLLAGEAKRRADAALSVLRPPLDFDVVEGRKAFEMMMASLATSQKAAKS